MKRPDLDAIEARAEAATPGPWFEEMAPDGEMMSDGSGGVDGHIETGAICSPPPDPTAEDAEPETVADDVCHAGNRVFIAAAREDVPALLAYVRELEGGLAALQATLGGGPGVPLDGEALTSWMLGGS